MPREARRKVWLDRFEWIAFVACLLCGAVLIWLFASATP
jgi:hypothetical protein